MVFASIYARKNSDQNLQMASSEHFVNFPLVGISFLLKGNVVLRQVIWLTPKTV